jgi:hypothetical protein
MERVAISQHGTSVLFTSHSKDGLVVNLDIPHNRRTSLQAEEACAGGRIDTRFLRPRGTSPLKGVNPAGTPGYRNGTESFFPSDFDRKNKESCQLGHAFRVICYEFAGPSYLANVLKYISL